MKAPTIEAKAKKQTYLVVGIICLILYIMVLYVVFHIFAAKNSDSEVTITQAFTIGLNNCLSNPLAMFPISSLAIKSVLIATASIAVFVVLAIAERNLKKHDNPDTVNGDARFMTLDDLKRFNIRRNEPYGKPTSEGKNNMILSKEIKIGLDGYATRRNANTLVIGGSGAGKSRFFAGPNILQANSNFVVTDPSGELLRDYGKFLENNGYKVRVFNLSDINKSHRYNPMRYIKSEKDGFVLINTFMKNTTPSDAGKGDQFFENAEKLLLTALIFYVWYMWEPAHQTFGNIAKLINLADIDENDASATESKLDMMFDELRKKDPNNIAVLQYDTFKLGSGKTLKSILISLGTRMQSFKFKDIIDLTSEDDFDFETFADEKSALFVVIPTADTSYNFIVSMLYTQLFSSLYYYCESYASYGWQAYINDTEILKVCQAKTPEKSNDAKKEIETFIKDISNGTKIIFNETKQLYEIYTLNGTYITARDTNEKAVAYQSTLKGLKIRKCEAKCPYHVRLILDEFANIGQIPDFDKKIATIRKYCISCNVILQSKAQLTEIYEKQANTIIGNCDLKLFLGTDDDETNKWLSEMLGKRTTIVENVSYQGKGIGSTSYNRSSIELMAPYQISLMPDDECIVRIRGERPYYGKKYELTTHPNYAEASKTKGQFVFSPPEKNKNIDNSIKIDSAMHDADGEKTEVAPDIVKDEMINTEKMARKNKARKISAKKAEEEMKKMEEMPVDNSVDIMNSFSVSADDVLTMSDKALKETIETQLILDSCETELIEYIMS